MLVARRGDRLGEVSRATEGAHGVRSYPLVLDLSEPGAPAALVSELDAMGRSAEVLVNNAGYGLDGVFLEHQWDAQAAMLQLMLTTPVELVHRLLPGMLAARRGRVLTVASLGGLLHSTPRETLYGPIKRFAIAFSRTLAAEYRNTGVTFTAVCPGFTRTEMMDRGRAAVAAAKLPGWLVAHPDSVARTAWRAAERATLVSVPGVSNKLVAASLRMLPTTLGDRLVTGGFDRLTGVR